MKLELRMLTYSVPLRPSILRNVFVTNLRKIINITLFSFAVYNYVSIAVYNYSWQHIFC